MKKNIRKIPKDVLLKLNSIKKREVMVGCAKKFSRETIKNGALKHLGIVITGKGLQVPKSILPPPSQGKFSTQNINGVEIKRKDLPKITNYHAAEAPNWGDSWKGTHTVYLPHKEYPRDYKAPRELEITMECPNKSKDLKEYVIAFRVNEVLNKKSKDFNENLFEDLNLLQENVGTCGVETAEKSLSEYIKSLRVSWEILPPGSREEALQRLFKDRQPTQHQKNIAGERYKFFISLKPKQLIFGTSGFRRYFGALLEENLVVFENIEYGNAIYILYEDWKELSKKSRIDLISGRFGHNFNRVIHHHGWKGEVRTLVIAKRKRKTSG